MKSISLKTKVITALLTGGMLLFSVNSAFTASANTLNTNVKAPLTNECRQPKGNLEATLKLGVSSNIITQAESDKILAYEGSKIKTKDTKGNKTSEKPDLFKELVTNKILTQAKADALKSTQEIQMETMRKQALETNLAKLVTDKTITTDQSGKIKAAMTKDEATKKADFEKTKAMTETERKAYMDANKVNHINPLKTLVDNGTITQAQADKVGFGGPGKFNGKAPFKNEFKQPKTELESTLKVAVSLKIITQTESEKILSYENSKIKTKDAKENKTAEKPDLFKELVTSKILTQVKADALKSSQQIQMETMRKQALETNLAKLVTDKTITEAQSDKIKAAIVKEEAVKKANFEKTKDMTEQQRRTYMDSIKTSQINPLKSLVDNGTITQAQADKIGPGGHGFDKHMRGQMGK